MANPEQKPQPETRAVNPSPVPNAWQCPFCKTNTYIDLTRCRCGARRDGQEVTK